MKIQKSSRVTALFLALVMILPLISIPTFAEEVTATPIWTNDVEDATGIGDVFTNYSNKATIDSTTFASDAKHNKVIAWDNTPDASWLDNGFAYSVNEGNGNDKWGAITAIAVDGEKGTGTFTYSGTTYYFDACTINKDAVNTTKMEAVYTDEAKTTAVTDKSFYLCTSQVRVAKQGDKANIAKPSRIIPGIEGQLFTLSADYYFSSDLDMQGMDIRLMNPSVHFFGIGGTDPGAGTVTVQRHGDLNKAQNTINVAHAIAIAKDAWHTFTVVVDSTAATAGTQITAYVDGQLCFDIFMADAEMTKIDWNVGHTTRGGKVSDNEGHWYADNFTVYEGNVVPESWNEEVEIYTEDFENLSVNNGYVTDGTQLVGITANTATVGEDNGNKYLKVAFGASTKDQNYMLKVPELSYNNYTWVKFEAKYNNQATAATTGSKDNNQGMMWSQYRYYSATGESNKGFVNLYRINVKNGQLISADGQTSFNNAIKQGWNTVTVYINLKTGEQNLYANGTLVIKGASIGKTNLDLFKSGEGYGRWTALKLDNSKVNYTEGTDYGYFGLDDASISYLYDLDETGVVYEATFEKDTVGNIPAVFDTSKTVDKNATLVDPGAVKQEGANKYWEFPISATNNNKHSYTLHTAVEHASTIVYQADNYISTDAAGSVEARFVSAKGTFINADGTTIENRSVAWLTMYKLAYAAGNNTVTVTPGGNQNVGGVIVANNTFKKGEWAKITVVIDAVNGRYDIYLNNTLIIADVCFVPQYHNGSWVVGIGLKDVKIPTSQLVYTPTSTATTGSIRLDNIAFYDTTDDMTLNKTITPFAGYSEDFSTATPNVVNKTGGYADATVPSTVVNGAYSIPTNDVATSNVNLVAKHASFNYLTAPKVVLEAKYTVPENGSMQIQSQIMKAKAVATGAYKKDVNWIDLYTIKATDTSTAPTVVFQNAKCVKQLYKTEVARGQEFTVSMIIDLKTGDADLYVDGILYAEGCLPNGYAEVDAYESRWIIAKPNTNTTYTGNLLVDDAKITVLDESKLVDETGKGLVSAKVNGKLVKDATKFYGTVTEQKYLKASDYAGIVATDTELGSLRIGETLAESGLRFATKIDTAMMDELKAMLENDEIKALTFGTLIAPNAYITANGALDKTAYTVYDETANEGAGNFVSGKTVVDVQATKYSIGDVDANPETTHFVGSLVKILEKNYDRTFAARGYVEVTLHNGEVIFLGSATTATNSVQAQAEELIPLYAGNAEVLAILNAYAGN